MRGLFAKGYMEQTVLETRGERWVWWVRTVKTDQTDSITHRHEDTRQTARVVFVFTKVTTVTAVFSTCL